MWTLLSALISGTILFGFGVASWYLIYRERLAAVDREIRTLAARHPGWLANRANFDPKAIVRWGDQTWEEMMIGFFTYTVEK